MPVRHIDHILIAMPAGREDEARAFYLGILGLDEKVKPPQLAARGGCWFESGHLQVHLGVEKNFIPARKAHPAFIVDDLVAISRKQCRPVIKSRRAYRRMRQASYRGPLRQPHRVDRTARQMSYGGQI
jgi:hypothetical protein